MGQKINPIGFRLALNRNWSSRWYANTKNFSSMLLDDIKVRDYLKSRLAHADGIEGRDRAPGQERAHYRVQRPSGS